MKVIATFKQEDVFPEKSIDPNVVYEERLTGKVIALDPKGRVVVVGNNENEIFQLPGGGIDDREEIRNGSIRECKEETGYDVEIIGEVGVVTDFRPRDGKKCVSYCFVAQTIGQESDVTHTEDEKSIGMFVRTIPVDQLLIKFEEQVRRLRAGQINFYNTGYNILRDYVFLMEAIESKQVYVSGK